MTKKNVLKRDLARLKMRFDGAQSLETRISRLEERAFHNEVPLKLVLLAGEIYGKYLRSFQGAGALPGLPEPNITNEELQLLQKLLKRIKK